jgi:hypothetical protein
MCSAYGGCNEVGGDAFHLQRLHGDPELLYLKNWLDFDPRVRRVRRYDYSQSAECSLERTALRHEPHHVEG